MFQGKQKKIQKYKKNSKKIQKKFKKNSKKIQKKFSLTKVAALLSWMMAPSGGGLD
jgi:hypothetical protein